MTLFIYFVQSNERTQKNPHDIIQLKLKIIKLKMAAFYFTILYNITIQMVNIL